MIQGVGSNSNPRVQRKRWEVLAARAELWAGSGIGLPGQGDKGRNLKLENWVDKEELGLVP